MLSPKHALRIAVVVEWVLIILAVVLSEFFRDALPEPLLLWLQQHAEENRSLAGFVAIFAMLPAFVLSIVASVGLFMFKTWARWLYLFSYVIGFIGMVFLGPTVEHAFANMIADVSAVLSGIVIGIAFFSTALEGDASQIS